LGIDNFAAAASIGLAGWNPRTCLKVCAVFGIYAAVAPAIGLSFGAAVAGDFESKAHSLGGVIIILVGAVRLVDLLRQPSVASPAPPDLSLRSLLSIGFGVSLDTLAAGFGLGLFGVPLVAAIAVIALATVLMTLAGFRLATLVAGRLGVYGERCAAAALLLVGLGLIVHVI
jgi:putative Mn2+ efflux pump MntP